MEIISTKIAFRRKIEICEIMDGFMITDFDENVTVVRPSLKDLLEYLSEILEDPRP